MLTAKKSNPKPKKAQSVKVTPCKPKPIKQPKLRKLSKPLEDSQTLLTNHPNIQHNNNNKNGRIPISMTCFSKEEKESEGNPYLELFQKCQRTISVSEYQLQRYKEQSKSKEKERQKEREKNKDKDMGKDKGKKNFKKKEKCKDLTFSPETKRQINNKKVLKKKQRSSRSVDNIKRLPRKVQQKSHSASPSPSAKCNKLDSKRKTTRTQADYHKRKQSNVSDLSLIRNKQQQTTQKKSFQRSRSKSVKLINLKNKRKSMQKIRTQGEQRCHNELDKIRALRQIIQIQKSLRQHLQNSKELQSDNKFEDSLITIKDFSQEEEVQSQKIMNLIQEIGENIDDQNLHSKLRQLSSMAYHYFQKRQKFNENTLTNKRTQSVMENQIEYEHQEKDNSQEVAPLKTHGFSLKLPELNILEKSCNEDVKEITQELRLPSSRPLQQHPHSFQSVISPKSYLSQIDQVLNEKSKMNNSKFQKKMDLLYKLYQNQLFSPKTFQTKLQFIQSVQMRQYQELDKQIQSALKIKTLINSMKKDKEEIAQLEEVYKDENWDEAINIMRVESQQNDEQLRNQTEQLSIKYNTPVDISQKHDKSIQNLAKESSIIISHPPQLIPKQQSIQKSLNLNLNVNSNLNQIQKPSQFLSQIPQLSEISVLKQFCLSVFAVIKQSPILLESVIANLTTPIEYKYEDYLSSYHQSIICQSNIYHYWKESVGVQKIISEASIEYIMEFLKENEGQKEMGMEGSEYYWCHVIHKRSIIHALNESLSYQRYHSEQINPPWVKVLKNGPSSKRKNKDRISVEEDLDCELDKIGAIFDSALERLLGWGRHYCGILMESISSNKIKEGINADESQCQQDFLRQVRMALMLHGSLIEYDDDIKKIQPSVTQIKLRLQRQILNSLTQEVAKEILEIKQRKKATRCE